MALEDWDARLTKWCTADDRDPRRLADILEAPAPWNAYTGAGTRALDSNALPEPYVGDPARNDLWALILTLNPGRTVDIQQAHPDGEYVRAISGGRNYSDLVGAWDLAPETRNWWRRRSRFASRILHARTQASETRVVGVDLIPWHSRNFGRIDWGAEGVLDWFTREVMEPARNVAARTQLSERAMASGLGTPLALAIGAPIREVLERHLGFRCKFVLDGATTPDGMRWPMVKGRPHRRVISWLESDEHGLAVLHTQLCSMDPPGEVFAPLLKRIVTDGQLRADIASGEPGRVAAQTETFDADQRGLTPYASVQTYLDWAEEYLGDTFERPVNRLYENRYHCVMTGQPHLALGVDCMNQRGRFWRKDIDADVELRIWIEGRNDEMRHRLETLLVRLPAGPQGSQLVRHDDSPPRYLSLCWGWSKNLDADIEIAARCIDWWIEQLLPEFDLSLNAR